MASPSVQERAERLAKARDSMKVLMAAPEPWKFKAECEGLFSEFRISCVHLRREREALDAVADKQVAWRFICRFSKDCPFQNSRCTEVLKILLLSDTWMKAFLEDPDVDVSELPPEIAEEFGKRLDEVEKDQPEKPGKKDKAEPSKDPSKDGYPKKTDPRSQDPQPASSPSAPVATIGGMTPLVATSMTLVVQRCVSAKLSSDDQSQATAAVGPGLLISVTMADGATEEGVSSAARFLLTAKLSGRIGWSPAAGGIDKFGGGAESVVSLCKAGEHQGIMVVPQLSLVADISKDAMDLQYTRTTKEHVRMAHMFDLFVDTLRTAAPELVAQATPSQGDEAPQRKGLGGFFAGIGAAVGVDKKTPTLPEIVAGEFGGNHYMEVKSANPFMHSFAF